MLTDGDYVWTVCPFCKRRAWCSYMCDIQSGAMVVFLCCEACEESQDYKGTERNLN